MLFELSIVLLTTSLQPEDEQTDLPRHLQHYFQYLPDNLSRIDPDALSDFERQIAAQSFPAVGREDLTLRLDETAYTYESCEVLEEGYGPVLEHISDAMDNAQIVIINEAHDQPLHRAMINVVGEMAALQGYEYFAAETFNPQTFDQRESGVIPANFGFYSREPIFTRQLLSLEHAGLTFVHYEQRMDQDDPDLEGLESIALREEAQANNLIENVLADDPDARILVHVGYSHVFEEPIILPYPEGDQEVCWFASRLKEKTGIDPVTISQVACSSENEEIAITAQSSNATDGAVDIYLAHPALTFQHSRPDWRLELGDRFVEVPEEFASLDVPVILEVRMPGEPLDHMPIERLMVYPGETDISLLIPDGTWQIDAFTADGHYGEPRIVSVD